MSTRVLVIAAAALAVTAASNAAPITTHESGSASITVKGIVVADESAFVLATDPVQAGTFTLTLEPAPAVPEPQTWALFAGGLAAIETRLDSPAPNCA